MIALYRISGVVFTVLSLLVACDFANGQDRKQKIEIADSDEIERGERLILEVARQQQLLPNRWAALIQYRVETTPDAPEYRLLKGSSYIVEDKRSDARVMRRFHSDGQRDNGTISAFEETSIDWQRGQEKLKRADDKWVVLHPGEQRPHLDPFQLWYTNSMSFTRGTRNLSVELVFLASVRSCLTSTARKGRIDTLFGTASPRDLAVTFAVSHDSKTEMPVEVVLRLYRPWDPKKLDAKNTLIQRTSATWAAVPQYEMFVPIEVHSNWMNSESLEAKFTVKWLFDQDVPDWAFVDPRVEKLEYLKFTDSKK
ncbi:MAG: hypothetical protein ABL921_11580 [Pirellula sp.]